MDMWYTGRLILQISDLAAKAKAALDGCDGTNCQKNLELIEGIIEKVRRELETVR